MYLDGICPFPVAEQAESIDNPMHEAAKRGTQKYTYQAFCLFDNVVKQSNVLCVDAGNLSWLRECLDNKVGINGLDKAGNTALYWACHGGHKGKRCTHALIVFTFNFRAAAVVHKLFKLV